MPRNTKAAAADQAALPQLPAGHRVPGFRDRIISPSMVPRRRPCKHDLQLVHARAISASMASGTSDRMATWPLAIDQHSPNGNSTATESPQKTKKVSRR
jgi:hypothetical protein